MVLKQHNLSIFKAAKEGDILALQAYLKQNPKDANLRDQNGYAPLHHIMRHTEKAQELMNLLLDFGADINVIDQKGRTPIVHTLIYDNTCALKALITKGADIFKADHLGATPILHATISHPKPKLLKILLQSGALNPNKDSNCKTLLHDTVIASSKYMTAMLQDGSKCNFQNNKKVFLLGQNVNYLIAYGQQIDTQDTQLISYLTNHFSSLAYCLSIENPIITLSTLSKLTLTFAEYIQNYQELTKNKVDIVLSLDRFFEFLPPYSLSPLLIKAKNEVLQEVSQKDSFTQIMIKIKQTKPHFFLDKNEETGLLQKSFTSPLNSLSTFIHHNLESNKDLSSFLYEIKQLYSDLFNLNQLDIYNNIFSNKLDQINQVAQQIEIQLQTNSVLQPHDNDLKELFADMKISGGVTDDSSPI